MSKIREVTASPGDLDRPYQSKIWARLDRVMTRKAWADELGVTEVLLSRWRHGRSGCGPDDLIEAIEIAVEKGKGHLIRPRWVDFRDRVDAIFADEPPTDEVDPDLGELVVDTMRATNEVVRVVEDVRSRECVGIEQAEAVEEAGDLIQGVYDRLGALGLVIRRRIGRGRRAS